YVNSVTKVFASQPRPLEYDSSIKALVHAGGGGLPSGHTQGAVVFWGFIAAQVKRPGMWILAGFLMIAIPLSRLYLGVHFPTDLLGGYLIGVALLTAYLRFGPGIEAGLAKRGICWQMAAAIGLSVGLILLSPVGARYAVPAGSALLGFTPGMILERRWVRFDCGGSILRRCLRFVVGMVVVVFLWAGLEVAFSGLAPAVFFRILRYALMGLWCSWGAPWLFVWFKLADTE
ncbi:MAG: phosphatase PAP2 family protein, partial [Desulfobacterales bacterium]